MISPEIKAIGGKVLWEQGSPIPETPPSPPLPKGARLSEPCPACRVLKYFGVDIPDKITRGVSSMGHLYEHLFLTRFFPDADRQYQINWGSGTTGLDGVTWDGPLQSHLEIKTSSSSLNASAANRWQVAKQRAAAEMSGIELPQSIIIVIGKKGKNEFVISNPQEVNPSPEDIRRAMDEILLTNMVIEELSVAGFSDPREYPELRPLRKDGCYGCYPLDVVVPEGPVLEFISEWAVLNPAYKEVLDWKKEFDKRVKDVELPIGRYPLPGVGELRVYESGSRRFFPCEASFD